jgi:hypothetical protein
MMRRLIRDLSAAGDGGYEPATDPATDPATSGYKFLSGE